MAQETLEITSVRIQNFRSIVDEHFVATRLNLFVGLNDVGKSNILRALDLFFNGANAASPYSFPRDFSHYAKTATNKAKEVRVHLTLKLPASYDATEIYWKKVWRAGGLYDDATELCHTDRTTLKKRSRVPALLGAVRFEYVPAIKSNDYFEKLLGALHDVLVHTVEREIRAASGGFTSTINKRTRSALDEIEQKLGIKSSIELPSDLRELFSRLEFQSKAKHTISLAQRGDGVKVRHIPILLKYLAQQARYRRVRGTPQPQTIWGFEEPENNLEMGKAADLAKEFVEYSKEVQIFATTHSPAFYSLGDSAPQTTIFLVTGSATDGNTEINGVAQGGFEAIDEHIGLLPIIAPSFARAVAERDKSLAMLEDIKQLNRPTVFVEGETDRAIIEKALGLFAPHVLEGVNVRSEKSAGANWVKDMLISWAHGRKSDPALGLCDDDDAGASAKRDVNEHPRVQSANTASRKAGKQNQIAVQFLPKPAHIIAIHKKGLKLPLALEEMFPISVWRHAEAEGWLELRQEIVGLNINSYNALSTTFEEHCTAMGVSADEVFVLTHSVRKEEKGKFAKYVCKLSGQALAEAFSSFEKLARDCEQFFGIKAVLPIASALP